MQARSASTASAVVLSHLLIVLSTGAFSQVAPERTIEEIKTEAVARAEQGRYPLIGLDPADVREAFASIKTRDPDEWAASFMKVADRYMNEGKSIEATNRAKANADYIRAWRLYSFGRWPIPSSPGKQRSYAKAIEAFLARARFFDPPLEVVRIPFESSQIIGYMRLPKNAKIPVPLVIAVNGLDSRKEDLSESFAAILPHGIGFLAVDGPGTGQAPIKASENADRMLSRVIDYVQSRPEIDKSRIAIHGVSWGAYWATKMSVVERARLRAASAQSPPIHDFFQKDFLMNSLLGNREYLFDQVPALMAIFDGVTNVDQLAAALAKMSLVSQNILGRPTTPMLVLAGVLDTQVPISDIYLLLNKGDVPKDAWIHPQGGHLGRQVKVWPDPVIFGQVIIPWLVRALSDEAGVATMTAFPAGEEQREFQYKSDCEIYTGTLHGWSRAAMKSSKICPILAHQVFGTVEEFFRGCGSNSERLGCAVTLDRHDPVKLLRATVHSKKAVREKRDRVTCGLLLQDRDCAATGSSWLAEEARVSSEMR